MTSVFESCAFAISRSTGPQMPDRRCFVCNRGPTRWVDGVMAFLCEEHELSHRFDAVSDGDLTAFVDPVTREYRST